MSRWVGEGRAAVLDERVDAWVLGWIVLVGSVQLGVRSWVCAVGYLELGVCRWVGAVGCLELGVCSYRSVAVPAAAFLLSGHADYPEAQRQGRVTPEQAQREA